MTLPTPETPRPAEPPAAEAPAAPPSAEPATEASAPEPQVQEQTAEPATYSAPEVPGPAPVAPANAAPAPAPEAGRLPPVMAPAAANPPAASMTPPPAPGPQFSSGPQYAPGPQFASGPQFAPPGATAPIPAPPGPRRPSKAGVITLAIALTVVALVAGTFAYLYTQAADDAEAKAAEIEDLLAAEEDLKAENSALVSDLAGLQLTADDYEACQTAFDAYNSLEYEGEINPDAENLEELFTDEYIEYQGELAGLYQEVIVACSP
ncbi:hypothetical protein [Glycomyces harbinensis]|uniref:Uncharacterized protein n=1 Tax=Glycomyces harbinensis TaxID=58114 RepID=A0A1G6SUD0_9ACTN|nr:hypothetical protein [Glycomyces harbinensis]SDD20540.1 hypothetical protein SAMN05216270_102306 [Glycomyces harbinensis]